MGTYFQSLVVIVSLLGLLLLMLWGVKKYGLKLGFHPGMKGRELKMEDHLSLGPKRDVCIVRYRNKHYMLGVTDQRVSLLSVLDPGKEDQDA